MSGRMVRLGDVCAKISDGTHQAPNWAATGVPFLFVSNVRNGTISFETNKFVSSKEYQNLTKNCPIEADDVLYTAVGSYGNSAVVPSGKTFVFQRHIAHLKPHHDLIDATYLSRMLETPPVRRQADKLARGVAQKTVTLSALRNFEIPLPPLEEQKRIAAILDKADALRRKRRQALALLESLTQSIFLEMFGDPVSNPKGWEWRKLGEIGSLDRGVSKHRPRNDPRLLGGKYPLIQTGDVANSGGYINIFSSTYSDFGKAQSKLWPEGTLCITIAANIGEAAILTFPACFPDSVVGFSSEIPGLSQYVRVWIGFLKENLEKMAPAVAQKNINLAILRGLDIPVPPRESLFEFNSNLGKRLIEQKMSLFQAQQLDFLFASLQHRAFTGQL